MKSIALTLSAFVVSAALAADVPNRPPAPPANPAIDMKGYLQIAQEAAKHRETRRLTEADFIRMSKEPGTLVLDCRSKEKYDQLHIEGAINLSFPDITVEKPATRDSRPQHARPDLLQQQFQEFGRGVSEQNAAGVAEYFDLHRASTPTATATCTNLAAADRSGESRS